jgi:hypothetical protein
MDPAAEHSRVRRRGAVIRRRPSRQLIRNRFSGARAPARLPVRVRTQTG